MISVSTSYNNRMVAPVREVKGKVELFSGSTLLHTFTQDDDLEKFELQRVGDGDVCGQVVCQKLSVNLTSTTHVPEAQQRMKPKIGFTDEYVAYPSFIISEVFEDHLTGELSITAYDLIKNSDIYTFTDLNLTPPYSMSDVVRVLAQKIGCSGYVFNTQMDLSYTQGANFGGEETLRATLDYIADATQTICYVDNADRLVFKPIRTGDSALYTIYRANYYECDNGDNVRVNRVCSTTELGDNVEAHLSTTGTTFYVRDNPFWNLREDIDDLVDLALSRLANLTINQFSCSWFANPALEIGDRIAIEKKDGSFVESYVFDDVIIYDGSLREKTQWSYQEGEQTDGNPTSLGDKINQTVAKVDKINKTIDLKIQDGIDRNQTITELRLDVDGITSDVQEIEGDITTIESTITQHAGQIASKISSSQAQSLIEQNIDNISISVSSGSSGSTFVLKNNGVEISSDSLDLHVKSANIDGTLVADSIKANSTISSPTISGGTIRIGNGNFTVSSNGTVSLAGVATFSPGISYWAGSSFDKGVDMGYLEIGHINDQHNTPKSNNWAITTAGTGYFTAIEGQAGDWGISSNGTAHGLKAIAVFG